MSGLRFLRVEVFDLFAPSPLTRGRPGWGVGFADDSSAIKTPSPPPPSQGEEKVLLLNCFEGCNAAIYHSFKLVIDIHAQNIRFVFARFFERIELAAQ